MMLKIEFEEQVWAQIINMLAEMPYKQSGAIINTMAQQIQEQHGRGGGNGSVAVDSKALHQREKVRAAHAVGAGRDKPGDGAGQ
jgi:hypothetical protein